MDTDKQHECEEDCALCAYQALGMYYGFEFIDGPDEVVDVTNHGFA